jgi:hypothetical protein
MRLERGRQARYHRQLPSVRILQAIIILNKGWETEIEREGWLASV